MCVKNQQLSKKRPVFDTSKKRMEGTDLESFLASRPYLKSKKPSTAELVSHMIIDGHVTVCRTISVTILGYYSTYLYTVYCILCFVCRKQQKRKRTGVVNMKIS